MLTLLMVLSYFDFPGLSIFWQSVVGAVSSANRAVYGTVSGGEVLA